MKKSDTPPTNDMPSAHMENNSDSLACSKLGALRTEIDKADTRIWSLLERRFALLKEIAKIKRDLNMPILDEKREKDVLAKIGAMDYDPEVSTAIVTLYKLLFELSRKYQG